MKPDFYFRFENKFRGDENSILEGLCIYDSLIHSIISHEDDPKILDIGCGRGEFIQKWKKYTPDVLGIESDSIMASICRSKGLNIIEDNALNSLQILPDNSISLITIFHVVEHLEFDQLFNVLSECSRVLQNHGVLIIETPSIDNLIVSTNNFYLDHSHKTHINADSFSFMLENIGFAKVKHYFLRGGPLQDSEHNKLTRLLNGVAQDLSFVATKSESIGDTLFNKNNGWESELNTGITTMRAAIDFDLAQHKQFLAQGKLLDLQGKLLNDVNNELLLIKNQLKYLLFFLKLSKKFIQSIIVYLKYFISFFMKIVSKIFNLLLRFTFVKKILLSRSTKKYIYTILDLLPNKIKLFIMGNIDKKIEKVSEIDMISSYNNKKLLSHYQKSESAKNIHEKLINRKN